MGLFKKKSGGKPKPFEFIQEEVKANSESEQALLKQVEQYHHQKNFEYALAELLLYFNMHPERDQFVLFLAATTLRSYFRESETENINVIASPILNDKRLDPIFMSCTSCYSYWILPPMRASYAVGSGSSNSNSCPFCGKKSVQAGRMR